MPTEEEEEKYEMDHPVYATADEENHGERHLNDDDHHDGQSGDDFTKYQYETDDDHYKDGDSRYMDGENGRYTNGDSRYKEDDSRYRDHDDASRFTEDDSRCYTEDQSHDDHHHHHHDEDESQDNTNDHYHDDEEDNSGHGGRGRNDKAERFRDEDDDDEDEDEFLKNDDCCKGCTEGCSKRCPCCTPCCNLFQKCCACLYPHGWYALLGQILAVLAFIVTILGYVSCYSAQQGDHNMSFVGQDLVTHRNNSYAGCLSWPHNHPPELDQMWKIGKSMDVVSMISGIICVVWILTFACFRWAKPLRYILMALFLFTGCAAGLALLAFKSKLCHTDPYHCNIIPAAIISGCAALNWFVCAFIIWHLQDPDDRDDEDFDDEEDVEDDDDDNDRVKKSGHRRKPEVIVEDLPDGSRKITKIKRRSDGSEKITETIIPAEEINYQQEHVKPYPEPEPSDAQTPQEEEYDDGQDSEAAPMVETFRDEPREGDDGFVTGFKAEPYHVPGQSAQEAAGGGSREMHVEPEPESNEPEQLLLLPMNDAHEEHQSNQSTSAVSDLLDDHYHEATANEQEAHSATAVFAAPHNADLLDDNAVVAAPRQPDLLDHFGYNTGDDESKHMLFHDDDEDDDEVDDEDVADLLRESNQRPAPPLQPQLTRPDDFRLKSEDYDNGIPLDPPTAPQLLAPAPRLDPPVHYSIDDDDDDDDRHVPEIV